ncbi:hypothetical protein WA026_002338 [Henosepilachna vigintioctopunctata]|uniref:Flavin-containing monooxygenase n=1 Tax=Henosepilachna vigintioctopunctata TaxID=420089 RepID=A0AAW1TZG4_9CUCU
MTMKIAIVGAGAAGLAAIKYSIDQGYQCEAFEQAEVVGGTWNYTDQVGFDKNGLPIRTSMYQNLRTNLPKEVMMFENFPYKASLKESYITQPEVLEYLNDFAEKLDLKKHIQFNTLVTHIEPTEDDKWYVEVQDAVSKTKQKKIFDAVIVANGKYHVPNMPSIPGLDTFSGHCIHSHDYRSAAPYTDKVVLVVGAGPSGIDISMQIHPVAKKVFLSFDPSCEFAAFIPKTLSHKVSIDKIVDNRVYFKDQSVEEIEEIILCTGYHYSFPFLSKKCGVSVDDNYVSGLYKELVCIQYPSMVFMCIPGSVCPIPTYELQLRVAFAMWNGHLQLPSREKMLKDAEEERKSKSCSNRKFHRKGIEGERLYWDDLAQIAGVKSVPNVVTKVHRYCFTQKKDTSKSFRIINDDEFEMVDQIN